MPTNLRDSMRAMLVDWRSDVDPQWRDVIADVEPDVGAIAPDLDVADDELIFPGRKSKPLPGARRDAHVFRALDGIGPRDVSVVVMGQDPYTQVAQATGRSFEQGDLADWLGKPKVTPSLRRMIQALAASRTGNEAYAASTGWGPLVDDLRAGKLTIEPPKELWDRWQSQGVIFLNAILTFNRYQPRHQFKGHGPLWAPIVRRLLAHLVRRTDRPAVFVTWGDKASTAFDKSGAEQAARTAGTWEKSVVQVKRPHPNAMGAPPPFLEAGNPWDEINAALQRIGGTPVRW